MKMKGKVKQAASAFLLGLVLSLQLFVALPGLHAWIHPDAADANHECAVTLFSHGQVHLDDAPAPIFYAPQGLIAETIRPGVEFVSVDLLLLPSRGPPAFSVPA